MGVDHDAKLIVGWSLDRDKFEAWIKSKKMCECYEDKACMSEYCWKDHLSKHLVPGLSIDYAGNCYSPDTTEYFLVLNKTPEYGITNAFSLQDLNALFNNNKEAIEFGKQLANELSYGDDDKYEPMIFVVTHLW
jgi:hypothetical protein